jgi:hypothetical protein
MVDAAVRLRMAFAAWVSVPLPVNEVLTVSPPVQLLVTVLFTVNVGMVNPCVPSQTSCWSPPDKVNEPEPVVHAVPACVTFPPLTVCMPVPQVNEPLFVSPSPKVIGELPEFVSEPPALIVTRPA